MGSKMRVLQRKIGSPVRIDLHKAHSDPLLDKIVPMDGSLDSMCVSKVLPPRSRRRSGCRRSKWLAPPILRGGTVGASLTSRAVAHTLSFMLRLHNKPTVLR